MIGTVLVVDDEPGVRYTLKAILEEEGLTVIEANDGVQGLEAVRRRNDLDLVITDLKMPRMDGMGLLAAIQELPRSPRVVVVTAHGSERTAVAAMKAGALDYFSKPFDADEIAKVVRRCLAEATLAAENQRLRARLVLGRTMVYESEAMHRVAEQVERVAARDLTVLLTGESGTGKELVAKAIVKASPRSERAYVRFNCAALPRELAEAELFGHRRGAFTGASEGRRGLFREADGGSLLLDEVNALDPAIQGKLLRTLQEGEVRPVGEDRPVKVDVRLIAATNADLAADPGFRQDLYYRLKVVVLHLPPLRDRPEDIGPLARHFAERVGERFGMGPVTVTEHFLDRLRTYPWPGNVRELEHTVERCLALSSEPLLDRDPFDGPRTPPEAPSLKDRVDTFERGLITTALARCHGNQSETARQLGMSRVTLLDKMRRHGMR